MHRPGRRHGRSRRGRGRRPLPRGVREARRRKCAQRDPRGRRRDGGVHVDEDRRAGTAAAHGELVDAQAGDRLWRRDGQCAKETEQGVLADGDGHVSAQIGSGPSAQEHCDVRELGDEGNRAACVSTRRVRYLLGERPTPATVVAAHETACPQIESHLTARNGTVHQAPLVMAVHARGSPSASRADGRPTSDRIVSRTSVSPRTTPSTATSTPGRRKSAMRTTSPRPGRLGRSLLLALP